MLSVTLWLRCLTGGVLEESEVSTEDTTTNCVFSVFLVASDSSSLSGDGANDDGGNSDKIRENEKHFNSIK